MCFSLFFNYLHLQLPLSLSEHSSAPSASVQMGLSLSIYRYARRLFHQYLDGRAIAHAENIESLLHGSDTHTIGIVDGYHSYFICQW